MADKVITDAVEYTKYEELNLPEAPTYQESFEYGKSIEKLDPNIHIKKEEVAPVEPVVFEYAICPTTATCVVPLSSHIIPLDFLSTETNDSDMLTTANRITITKAGSYMVTGSIVYGNLETSGTWRSCSLKKNGSSIAVDEINPRSGWTYTNATCITKCIVGDYIELLGLNDASACVDTRTGSYQTFLHVARLSD